MDLHTWLDLPANKGKAAELALHLGASKTAVSLWRKSGVPLPHMPAIVAFTGGVVSVEDMAQHAIVCRAEKRDQRPAEAAA